MGAVIVSGTFSSRDWRDGIRRLQSTSQELADIDFRYDCETTDWSIAKRKQYINRLADTLQKRDGVVYGLGVPTVKVVATKYSEVSAKHLQQYYTQHMDKNTPASLFCCWNQHTGCTGLGVTKPFYYYADAQYQAAERIASGTVSDLKAIAHKYLRNTYYSQDYVYYIVTKGGRRFVRCYGHGKTYQSTKRVTDDKWMVLPQYEYGYIGVASK